jgi:hypothetical protein
MADKKISQLLAASTPLAGTEVLPIVQSGNTVKATVASITDRLGLGSMATQNANNVAVTGGSINGTAIGASTRAAGAFTDVVTDDGTHGRWTIAQNASGNNLLSTTPGFAGYRTCALYASGGATPNMTWGSDGNTTVGAGNLIIGTAGKGIDFSADGQAAGMTSELLDDYEEGTWTPSYTAASGAFTTLTYAAQTGVYTRIGNVVYFKCEIRTSNVDLGTASGLLRIAGLPFTPASNSGANTGASVPLFIRFNLAATLKINTATVDPNGIYFDKALSNDTGGVLVAVSEMTTGVSSSANYTMVSGFYNV